MAAEAHREAAADKEGEMVAEVQEGAMVGAMVVEEMAAAMAAARVAEAKAAAMEGSMAEVDSEEMEVRLVVAGRRAEAAGTEGAAMEAEAWAEAWAVARAEARAVARAAVETAVETAVDRVASVGQQAATGAVAEPVRAHREERPEVWMAAGSLAERREAWRAVRMVGKKVERSVDQQVAELVAKAALWVAVAKGAAAEGVARAVARAAVARVVARAAVRAVAAMVGAKAVGAMGGVMAVAKAAEETVVERAAARAVATVAVAMVVVRAKCQAPSTPRPDSGCCRASCCTWGSDSNQVGSWHLGLSCRLPAHIRSRFGTTRTARRGECSWRRCRCLNHTTRSHNSRLRDSCRRPHTRIGSHCPRDRPPFCRKTRRVRHLRLRGSKCCRPSFGRKELAVEDGRSRRARGTARGPTGAASSAS
jgi:hypothetical protein